MTRKSAHISYIPCLDGIRAIACLLVFAGHAGLQKVVPGGLGVTIFFFLSGYLITTLLRQEGLQFGTISLKNFYIRRAFRILPPMYIALAIAGLLGVLGLVASAGIPQAYISAITYVQNYYRLFAHTANLPSGMGVLWSLAVEEHFYLVWPLLFLLFLKFDVSNSRMAKLLLIACAIAPLWRLFLILKLHILSFGADEAWTYIATDSRYDSMAWGCLMAVAQNPLFADKTADKTGFLERFKGWFAAGGVVLLLATLLYRNPVYREGIRYTIQAIALYPLFYFCLSSPKAWAARWLEWLPLRWIGRISYSFYLMHLTMLHVSQGLLGGVNIKAAFLALALTIAYAAAMWFAVERPLARLRKRLTATSAHSKPGPAKREEIPSSFAEAGSSAPVE